MENTVKIKNRAFKKWLLMNQKDTRVLGLLIYKLLSEQNQMAFELMQEADALFDGEGYMKAAQFVINQLKDEKEV